MNVYIEILLLLFQRCVVSAGITENTQMEGDLQKEHLMMFYVS